MTSEKKDNILRVISTLNVVMLLVGYGFVTCLFSDSMSSGQESHIVTVPFRALQLGLSLTVIFLCLNKKQPATTSVRWIWVFWGLLLMRFIFDVYIKMSINIPASRLTQIWMYMVALTLIPMYAVQKSYRYIDYKQLLNWSFYIVGITVLWLFITNENFQTQATARLSANSALGSLGAGYLGLMSIIISYFFYKQSERPILKIAAWVIIGVSVLIWLRAGSRGPILAFIVIVTFYLVAQRRNISVGVIVALLILFLGYVSLDYIINWLADISPILKERLFERETSQISDRAASYQFAIDSFWKNPLIGHDFAVQRRGLPYGYSHNIVLEALMQLGLIGFMILLVICLKGFIVSFRLINMKNHDAWLSIVWIEKILLLCVSGTYYFQSEFWILMVLLFMKYRRNTVKHNAMIYKNSTIKR